MTLLHQKNVSIFWNPINQLASILLTVFLLASIFVFFAVSISHDRVQLPGLTSEVSPQVAPVLKKEVELDSEPINFEVAPEVVPIIEKEVENHQKTGKIPWNKFKVGNKQKVNIKTFLKRRIKFDEGYT